MTSSVQTASGKHYEKTLKGLRQVLPDTVVNDAISRSGLPTHVSADERVAIDQLMALTDHLARETKDPLLLLRAFSRLDYTPSMLRSSFLGNTRTLMDAVRLIQRYLMLDTGIAQIDLDIEKGQATIRLLLSCQSDCFVYQPEAILYALQRTLTGLGLKSLDRIFLCRTLQEDDALEHWFGVPIVFGASDYGIQFQALELARAIGWSGDSLRSLARRERRLIRLNTHHQWTGSVITLLEVLLRHGKGSIDDCARLLAVSRRTLQRRIKSEGPGYRSVLRQTRQHMALRHLADGYALDTVALLVGYQQTAQFYRAFQAWFGQSPGEYCVDHGIQSDRLMVTSYHHPDTF
ncbi:helix-turn-helix transcriptional regulator [Pseudomonas sp. EA_105y_Pfl2_R69]|uniref:helix-turn-helix transcriptional regulator n=1 Tax=Pseudomonas sp. EA_105y_Pfl2_R69 TaxID=3088683 RepID=UPI0030DCD717